MFFSKKIIVVTEPSAFEKFNNFVFKMIIWSCVAFAVWCVAS